MHDAWNRFAVAAFLATGLAAITHAEDPVTLKAMSLEAARTEPVSCRYWLSLPDGYTADPAKRWPLLLFLHGAGERGASLDSVKKHGPPKRIASGTNLPFVVVAPQCPSNDWWESTRQCLILTALLDEVQAKHRIDPDRVYCTGLSMGGYGTWRLACETPDRFAAVVPICGGGRWFNVGAMRNVPAWVFHGAKDTVVPLAESEKMVNALRKAGGTVEFTVYPEAQHDSWTTTYDNPAVYDWLLKQVRKK
jgi:predicted peptidase